MQVEVEEGCCYKVKIYKYWQNMRDNLHTIWSSHLLNQTEDNIPRQDFSDIKPRCGRFALKPLTEDH